jgi:hypothetical protein
MTLPALLAALRFPTGVKCFFSGVRFNPAIERMASHEARLSVNEVALFTIQSPDFFQVTHESFHLPMTRFFILRPQDRRRMNGCRYQWGQRRINQFPSVCTDAKVLPEQGLCGGGSQTNQNIRFDHRDLGVEPGAAGTDFRIARLLVDATFASLLRNLFENALPHW